MEILYVGLHKRESQLAIKAEDGTITDRRIVIYGLLFVSLGLFFGGASTT